MKIQSVMNLVESVLNEISSQGAADATKVSEQDFEEIKNAVYTIGKAYKNAGIDPNEIKGSFIANQLKLVANNPGQFTEYFRGQSSGVEASMAQAGDRGDDERRSAEWAGPDKRKLSSKKTEAAVILIQALDQMQEHRYVAFNEDTGEIKVLDKPSLSRIGDFLGTVPNHTVTQIAKNFNNIKREYQMKQMQKFSGGKEQSDAQYEDTDALRSINPNMLIFLAQVSKNYGRRKRWDEYLNPSNYEDVSDNRTKGFMYDPRAAAEQLVKLGMAEKSDRGYMLNRDRIRKLVANARAQLRKMKVGTTMKPSDIKTDPTKGATREEKRGEVLVNFVRQNFSDRVWEIGKKNALSFMANNGDENVQMAVSAYRKKQDVVGDRNEEGDRRGTTTKLSDIDKTDLGKAVNLLAARFVVNKMVNDADRILGKKPSTSLLSSRDLNLLKSAFRSYRRRR